MPNVSQYYPGDFYGDTAQSLAWLYAQQEKLVQGWEANALQTGFPQTSLPGAPCVPTTPPFIECGIVSQNNLGQVPQTACESIAMIPPGILMLGMDDQLGPDGYPIDLSPIGLPYGSLFPPVLPVTAAEISAYYQQMYSANPNGSVINGVTCPVLPGLTVYGYLFNPQRTMTNYRIDLFAKTDIFYYQGSAPGTGAYTTGPMKGQYPAPSQFQSLLVQQGLYGYWGAQVLGAGVVMAVLYPTSVAQPSSGWSGEYLPAGWLCHSNTGVGYKLTNYFARIYAKTDVEYLQEDNIPIIVQDDFHARCGSILVPRPGLPTVHVMYNDPVKGPTQVCTSLAAAWAFPSLPLSFIVPTSDPLYFPDPTATNGAALQNRSYIYDCALAIIAFAASGNFVAAARIITQLDEILDNPGYLATMIFENGEDGQSATRWIKSNAGDSVTDVNDPTQPPYGGGLVVDFHATAANDTFTYSGSGFPDTTDTQVQFQHKEAQPVTFNFAIGVTTAAGKVTSVQVTSAAVTAPSLTGTVVTIAVGPGNGLYRFHLINLADLVSTLAGDTLTSMASFVVTLSAAGDMYFDNFSVGNTQPANSLAFSYDTYYGLVDQAYIRAGAMAWVCYAYCIYMQLTQDYSPALYLQRMLNFLLTLQSAGTVSGYGVGLYGVDAYGVYDLTGGLFYLGWGSYENPGYQFVPGIQYRVSTEHQIDLYFAFMRGAATLPTAATQLQKTNSITAAQAASLNATAAQVANVADTIATQVVGNLYIAPSHGVPGHFAQGAGSAATPPAGLDTSQACDAAGDWAALFCHAIGRDDLALQCLEFVDQNFLIQNQQILKSAASNSYNETYQQLTSFSGFKFFNDSAGGYAGSPLSVSQEQSWSMLLALLDLYDVPGVANYFAGVYGSLDAYLTTLITSQRTVRATTGDGSLLMYSLASRDLPYEFEVWPAFTATAWFYLVSAHPGLLLSLGNTPTLIPYLQIPQGASQSVNELEGESSLGSMTVTCIDPNGTLKGLAAQDVLIGRMVQLKQGFPGMALGDFTTLQTMQITQVGQDTDGRITIQCADVQRFIQGMQIWLRGGPLWWTPGGPMAQQPIGASWLENGFQVSDQNPRYVAGNPIDIILAVLQNELGVGQDPALLTSNYVMQSLAPIYQSQQDYEPLPPPEGWAIYAPGQDSTLINPNPYIDIPGFLALRDGEFSGVWFDFVITRPIDGKQFLEEQILKALGLYTIVRPDGRLSLKTMKPPVEQTPVFAFSSKNIMGIPQTLRQSIINLVTLQMDVQQGGITTAARSYGYQVSYQQQTSLKTYRQVYEQQIQSTGLRVARGGMMLSRLLADRIFRRHAFQPPTYKFTAQLATLQVELGDYVWLSHPKVLDLAAGKLGLNNVVCEVVDKQPNYSQGTVDFSLLDTRYINLSTAYQIAPAAANIPGWNNATAQEQAQYMFISPSS
ncbi:MAG: hypothetical protein ACLQVM_04735 [Terriglobia bacterium]